MASLSEQFQKTQGAPVERDGRTFVPMHKIPLRAGRNAFVVRRLAYNAPLVPGLRIKAVKGEIEVNGQTHSEVILWADTSPDVVTFDVKTKVSAELRLWNVWRAGDLVQAWVGEAGISVTQAGSAVILECSGGDVQLNCAALVVEIEPVE